MLEELVRTEKSGEEKNLCWNEEDEEEDPY